MKQKKTNKQKKPGKVCKGEDSIKGCLKGLKLRPRLRKATIKKK